MGEAHLFVLDKKGLLYKVGLHTGLTGGYEPAPDEALLISVEGYDCNAYALLRITRKDVERMSKLLSSVLKQ